MFTYTNKNDFKWVTLLLPGPRFQSSPIQKTKQDQRRGGVLVAIMAHIDFSPIRKMFNFKLKGHPDCSQGRNIKFQIIIRNKVEIKIQRGNLAVIRSWISIFTYTKKG